MLIKFTLFLTNENTLENFNTNQPRDDLHANIVQGFGLKFSIPSNYALLLIIHYYYDRSPSMEGQSQLRRYMEMVIDSP